MGEQKGGSRIALLSNVNMNAVIRALNSQTQIYEPEGYGNELGILLNPASSYHAFAPRITFLVLDLLELTEHELTERGAALRMDAWLGDFENALRPDGIYYVSDAYLWGEELDAARMLTERTELENLWNEKLKEFCGRHSNVRILPYHRMICRLGEENAFSRKMWYMGKMPLGNEAGKRLAELILEKTGLESRTPKKVLALDLDNTLWGGLAGEHDHRPILLSEEHGGLAYKNLQRVILQMQRQGVILVIVSKNNPGDVEELMSSHPHMVLRPECFAARRINWEPKHENLMELSKELNLGLDSFVFWDDNPQERMLVSRLLPQVTVPPFPDSPEELAPAMTEIYRAYFEKPALTREDLDKTGQYADNAKREAARQRAQSFEDYLKALRIVVTRVDAADCAGRLEALFNKTNQFNLTTKRHAPGDLERMVRDKNRIVYAYRVEDCFGDSGIVAALTVCTEDSVPVIEEFVMSCRVMGRNIEQGILGDVERSLQEQGYKAVRGVYIPTDKNKPVAELYRRLGYKRAASGREPEGGAQIYELELDRAPVREFIGEIKN